MVVHFNPKESVAMDPIVTMIASAAKAPGGGTECHVTVSITHDGKMCRGEKTVTMAPPPSSFSPYAWAQEALCALIDGLDCLCDVKVTHDEGCSEVGIGE